MTTIIFIAAVGTAILSLAIAYINIKFGKGPDQ